MALRRFLYITAVLLLLLSILLPPFLHSEFSKPFYTFYSYLDHQYPSRSLCLFFTNGSFAGVGDCIEGTPYGETNFLGKKLSGPFLYSKEEVGINRMDTFYYDGRVGYKLPICARDTGVVLGLLLAPLLYRFLRYRGPLLLALALPLAVDGLLQLLTSYEASNTVRLITGLLAGMGVGAVIYGNWVEE